eukprot:gnl/TRDRNA2_/TRDRNA2_57165_c0_seq1.p1 gnl/TRDRNA2_/TRDRNA2_57165_c0~~gnl/TRDRNA2_/TRDRNA2_57165_c0_seq1.p1  ORF type:complete len:106 (+),score=15.83 gnl/TRDRNA2_/TRDRNA2_57165_c0_seq1:18-335(+)
MAIRFHWHSAKTAIQLSRTCVSHGVRQALDERQKEDVDYCYERACGVEKKFVVEFFWNSLLPCTVEECLGHVLMAVGSDSIALCGWCSIEARAHQEAEYLLFGAS